MPGKTGAIKAGRTYVEAFLEDSALTRGLKAAEKKLQAFGSTVTGIGAGLVGVGTALAAPFLAASKGFADAGSELADMSARTGVSVEALSMLGHAAQQTGTDLATVEGAVRKMQKGLTAAAMGSQDAQVAFASLGLDVARLQGLAPEDQFTAVAKAIGRIPNPTTKAAAAMEIFGKSGTALLPLIDDIDALTKEAKDLGLVMSSEDAEAADALGDALDNVKAVLGRTAQVIGASLAPTLTDVAQWLARTAKTAIDWANANRPLIVTVLKVTGGIVAAGAAFIALGMAISAAGAILGTIAAGFGAIGAAVGALLSPIGLVVAGLTGLTAWFVTSTTAGGQALGWLGERFAGLKETATTAFKGIGDALASGDIALAGQILWAALRVEFQKGVNFLKGLWADWGVDFRNGFTQASTWLASAWVDSIAFLQSEWAKFISDITGSWGQLAERLISAIVPPIKQIADLLQFDISENVDQALAGLGVATGGGPAHEAALQQQLAGIEADRQQQQQALIDQQEFEAEQRRTAARAGLAEGESALAAAMAEFQALTAKAAEERAAIPAAPGGKPGAPPEIEEFTPEGLDQAAQATKRKVDVAGAFGAANLRGLGVGTSVADEQLKEQKKASEQLQKLNDKARQGRLVFSA